MLRAVMQIFNSAGAGVSSLNTLSGPVNITSTGATIAITTVGNNINIEGTGSGTTSFSGLTSGTNTSAAMAVGSGASLTYTGTGTITATHAAIANEATDTTCFPLFVTTATGDQAIKSNVNFTLNSNTGALGATSFSGAGTGLTGTAASLTAGTVTTNANLTGPITSVGNTTSVNSQTGTGSTFVMSNSPTITTAALGSSTATTQTPGDNSTKLATTAYVQAALFATTTLPASKYATTAALPAVTYNNGASGVGATLTEVGLGALTVDGVTPSVNDIILVKNQVSTFQNGIYSVTTVGSVGVAFVLTRTSYYNQTADIDLGDNTFVISGSTLASTTWTQNGTENPVIGTDAITFAQTTGAASYTAGNGISITGTSIAIDTSITVDKTTVQTLTNKTLTAPTISDPVLSQNASPTYARGRLVYDTTSESLTFYNNDSNISLQIGQEEWIQVINNTGSTIANGSAVYLSGASGSLPTIALAQSNAGATTIGAGLTTESIANGGTGYVTCIGVVHGIDTSGFSAGATVYISSTVAGGLVYTAPLAPNYRYRVGIVGVSSATVGTIMVTPSTAALGNGTANQLFGMNTAGTAQEVKSLVAGTNITITPGTNTLTIAASGGGSSSPALPMVMGMYTTYP